MGLDQIVGVADDYVTKRSHEPCVHTTHSHEILFTTHTYLTSICVFSTLMAGMQRGSVLEFSYSPDPSFPCSLPSPASGTETLDLQSSVLTNRPPVHALFFVILPASLVPRPFLYGRGKKAAFLAPPIQEGSGNQTTYHWVSLT